MSNNPIFPGPGMLMDVNQPADIQDFALAETPLLYKAYIGQHASMTGFAFRPWVCGCNMVSVATPSFTERYLRYLVPPKVGSVRAYVWASGGFTGGLVRLEVLNSGGAVTDTTEYSFTSGQEVPTAEDAGWFALDTNADLTVVAAPTWDPTTVRLRLKVNHNLTHELSVYGLCLIPSQIVI